MKRLSLYVFTIAPGQVGYLHGWFHLHSVWPHLGHAPVIMDENNAPYCAIMYK